MKKNKLVALLTRWEVFLIVLLALMCLVFNLQDAARVASGEARRDVFNVANVVRSMRPYMLYSFMTLGMMLILAMGDMDISVGAAATLSVVVLGVTYNGLTTSGLVGLPALIIALAACLLVTQSGDTVMLSDFYSPLDWQNPPLAESMVSAAVDGAWKNQAALVFVQTVGQGPFALYRRMGFEPVEMPPVWWAVKGTLPVWLAREE